MIKIIVVLTFFLVQVLSAVEEPIKPHEPSVKPQVPHETKPREHPVPSVPHKVISAAPENEKHPAPIKPSLHKPPAKEEERPLAVHSEPSIPLPERTVVPKTPPQPIAEKAIPQWPKRGSRSRDRSHKLDFYFDSEDLSEILKRFAKKKNINIILPQGVNAMTQKVSFHAPRALTIEEAESYVSLFLDLAGYALRPGEDYWIVVKDDKNGKLNPFPLYVNVPPDKLPQNDSMIRAIYYLSNLKVDNSFDSPLMQMLKEMLTSADSIIADPLSNGLIITDRARTIASAMNLILGLDMAGSPFVLENVQLFNSSASYVANFLKSKILTLSNRGSGPDDKSGVGSYFSTSLRLVADERRNTLIILGKEAPVHRLVKFIREVVDAATEPGESIFHVYDLKYRDAQTFADVLNKVVQGTTQSDQTTGQKGTGPMRFFEGVIIKAETPQAVEQSQTQYNQQPSSTPTSYRGANRLLVAAQQSDWVQLKKLIEKLDVPQRQVILEVMIVDYTRSPQKTLGMQLRNPLGLGLGPGREFQSAQITDVIGPTNSAGQITSIEGDLLLAAAGSNSALISSLPPGSLAISFNDPANNGIWNVLTMLDTVGNTKVLSQPYLIVLDNVPAQVNSSEVRRGSGGASSSTGGAITVNQEDIPAHLLVSITPRISSAQRLNLDILVDITQFTTETSAADTRLTRQIQTNANLESGQILVLGGLTKTNNNKVNRQIPILGQIPLLGWFFRWTSMIITESELGIFVKPTILEPKIMKPAHEYTSAKLSMSTFTEEGVPNARDPIVKFFFNSENPNYEVSTSILESFFDENIKESKKNQRLVCKPPPRKRRLRCSAAHACNEISVS